MRRVQSESMTKEAIMTSQSDAAGGQPAPSKAETGLSWPRKPQVSRETWMAICDAHPRLADALDGTICLCDGSWPGPLSATIQWRAFRALNADCQDDLSKRLVDVVDQVLALRQRFAPELHIWQPDTPSAVPHHWRKHAPAIDALLSELDAKRPFPV